MNNDPVKVWFIDKHGKGRWVMVRDVPEEALVEIKNPHCRIDRGRMAERTNAVSLRLIEELPSSGGSNPPPPASEQGRLL